MDIPRFPGQKSERVLLLPDNRLVVRAMNTYFKAAELAEKKGREGLELFGQKVIKAAKLATAIRPGCIK